MSIFKNQDFTGGYDQTWGLGGNQLLYLIQPKQATYLSLLEESYKSTPRPALKRCCYRSTEHQVLASSYKTPVNPTACSHCSSLSEKLPSLIPQEVNWSLGYQHTA